MMQRRTLLGAGLAGAATLASPAIVRAQAATTLKFIPYADLALLDPAVSAFVTRNHVMMVFDTLFGVDEQGNIQPQMLEGFTREDDGLTWNLSLRDGLTFHDGTKVLARDAVASIQRWWVNDGFGQSLAEVTAEVSAPSDKVIRFRLKRVFDLLPAALAHPTNTMAVIMPERLAKTPASTRLVEMVGSGPFRYLAAERVPGARNVYARFEGYLPRQGQASFTAGPRVVHFDRVEWLTTPDPATQIAALRRGEVDWVEQPLMDLVPSLRTDSALRLTVAETKGLIGFLRFNFLYPPFDNPAIRRVVLRAINQADFMDAVVGGNAPVNTNLGVFTADSAYANDAGMEALGGQNDLASLKAELKAAGYQGEKVLFLAPTDVPRINAIAFVGIDMLRKLGMNVEVVATDWGTVVQRSVSRQPMDKGGWNMFCAFTGGIECSTPSTHQQLRANGAGAYNGWPNMPKLEALRTEFLFAPNEATRLDLARRIQLQAFADVPHLPLGSYDQPTVTKANLVDLPKGLILFNGVRRV